MMIDFDKIVNSKWEDGMPTVPSNSIDLIITSPPYNVNLGKNKFKKDAYESYDDNMPYTEYLQWMNKLFIECHRILKIGGRLCVNIGDGANGSVPTHADFTYNLLHLYDKEIDNPFKMMTTIVWNKNQIGSSTAWGSFQSPSCPWCPGETPGSAR